MASITFAAPVIRAAIASLQASLPAQIADFNAEPENAVDLAAPVAYAFGAQDPLGTTGFPVVEVAAVEGRSGAMAVERGEWDHDLTLTVVVWHEGDRGELETTYEMSLGLARCCIEVLTRPGALGDGVEIADDGGVFWRSDAMPADLAADGREFRKWRVPVLVQLAVRTVERMQ